MAEFQERMTHVLNLMKQIHKQLNECEVSLKDQDKDGIESGKLRMFSDEFRAIKKAFEIFA